MTSAPRFSVLLPTHNRADVLPFAIRSVLAQTSRDFELLIVGDGCTDDTAAVVHAIADDRIRWLDLSKGPGFGYGNRNVALRGARGRYVAYIGHDDVWLPDHLELLAGCIERRDVDLVYSRPVWVIPPGLIAPVSFNLHVPSTRGEFLAGRYNGIPACCVMHRRECLDQVGYWDESLPSAADMEMWARIIRGRAEQPNFGYVPEPTTLHFRANWRTAHTTEQRLLVWQRYHDQPGIVPSALKISILPGQTEQAAAWHLLSSGPAQWTRRLRDAVVEVLDGRAELLDQMLLPLLKLYEGKGAAAEFAKVLEQPSSVAVALATSRFSPYWKVLDALRDLKRRALPSGTIRGRVWRAVRDRLVPEPVDQ